MKEIEQLISESNGIDHVAYATKNTDKTIAIFKLLDYEVALLKKEINRFNIIVSKMTNYKGDVIEIVEPVRKPNPVQNVLKNNDCAIYHICFKVKDFYTTRKQLLSLSAVTLTKPFESLIFDGYMVSHMYHPSIGVFEIFGSQL